MTEEKAASILAAIYEKALDGVPKVSRSVDDFANDYTSRYGEPKRAAKELVKYQILKCGTSGFVTGLGGAITLPVAIPANIGSVLYVQMRMVAAIAKIGGYDVRSDQVQTLVYMCLTGTAITDVVKQAGIQIGEKTLTATLKKMPATALTKINQRIGFRLVTKFGEKGVINLGKLIPVAGGVIGGTMDVVSTTVIAKNAINLFIEGTEPKGDSPTEEEIVEVASIIEDSQDDISAEKN
ncbi:EcsC family protein [Pseudoscardovia radai]|uniref:EcsC family protein n=1 Tax=Pseudoscardovia radai TaxID=987066 RepID=UPI00399122B1